MNLENKHFFYEVFLDVLSKNVLLVLRLSYSLFQDIYSVPPRKFCLRAKVTATTHFRGPDFARKGHCTGVVLICQRVDAVGKLKQ